VSIYGCDSCKLLRRKLSAKSKELGQLRMMQHVLESTKREYADECEGYDMARCVDCPAYPACRALEAGKPRRKRRM